MATPLKKREHKLNEGEHAQMLLQKFAVHLKLWMEANKLDHFQVGRRVGCSGYQIRHMLRCENYPSTPVYWALCREMGHRPLPDFKTS